MGGLAVGMVVVVLACTAYLVPFREALVYYAIWALIVLACPWACLEEETKKRAFRVFNRFEYFAVATLIVALVTQWGTKGSPFPIWAIAAIVTAGIAAYSVIAYYAIVNFQKWCDGGFRSPDGKKT